MALNEKMGKKIELVNRFLKKTLKTDIVSYIKISKWKDKSLILRLVQNKMTANDITTLNQTLSNSHRMDYRTPEQLALNLVLGWVVEDAIRDKLLSMSVKIQNSGTDGERKFNSVATNIPDLVANGEKYLEVVMGYTSAEKKYGIALRDNKYENLKEFNSALVGVDLLEEKLYIIKNIGKKEVGPKEFNPRFGKMTQSIPVANKEYYTYSSGFSELAKILK